MTNPTEAAMVQSQTLDLLFERDPEKLSPEDKVQIIAEFRAGRARWMQEDSAAKTQGRKVKISQGMKAPTMNELGLSADDILS